MYRSGHNELDSKSSCRATGTWVRIPPSPLYKKPRIYNIVFTRFFVILISLTNNILHHENPIHGPLSLSRLPFTEYCLQSLIGLSPAIVWL